MSAHVGMAHILATLMFDLYSKEPSIGTLLYILTVHHIGTLFYILRVHHIGSLLCALTVHHIESVLTGGRKEVNYGLVTMHDCGGHGCVNTRCVSGVVDACGRGEDEKE